MFLGSIARRSARSRRHADDEAALTADIVALAIQYGRYGYRRITAMLRRAGWVVNHKRVERIWRREGLKVPPEAAEAGQALAQRWIMHPAAAGASKPRLVLRLCRGSDPRRAKDPHAERHR